MSAFRGLLAVFVWVMLGFAAQPAQVRAQTAPAITLTSPSANAVISEALTPTVVLQAAVTTVDTPIAQVIFYYCPSVGVSCTQPASTIAIVTSPPYEFSWTPPNTVSQTALTLSFAVWAMAVDSNGVANSSVMVPITILQPPPAPSIALAAPRNDSGFVTPASPVLYVTASPGNTSPLSSIARVDFLDGESVIGSINSPNAIPTGYAFTWVNAPIGIHLVTARATDSLGYSTSSAPLLVYIIGPDPAPQVALGAPATGQIFASPISIPLSATAGSALGTIQRVEFMAADLVVATVFAPPYVASWINPPAGNFAVVAKAYDDIGVAATSSAAYIQVLPEQRVPVVVMTSPTPGAVGTTSSPLTMTAAALAPDGGISRVDYFAESMLIGSAAIAPYTFAWTAPLSGAHVLYAKAWDLIGRAGTSQSIPVSVPTNAPPTVSITSPVDGAQFDAPSTISFRATATDRDGTIASVDYFINDKKVATASAAPYAATASIVGAGSFELKAVATDNIGDTGTSAVVTITATAPAPTVALMSPQSAAAFTVGQPIVLTAQANAPARQISRIEFYSDGTLISGRDITGGPSTINVTLSWTGAPAGTHALSAKVITADQAQASSSTVNITVSDFRVVMVEPAPGQNYQAPAQVRIAAASPTGNASPIARIEFYGDGVLVGVVNAAPYALSWNGVGDGSHEVMAVAFDTSGLVATSAKVSITVQPVGSTELTIASPTAPPGASASVAEDFVLVHGTYVGPPNTGITVNGIVAETDGNGHFAANAVPLDMDANTIDVVLTTLDGQSSTKSLNLVRSGSAPFRVAATPDSGFAPFTTLLMATSRRVGPVKHVDVTNLGGGTYDASLMDGQTLGTLSFANPGLYLPQLTLTYQNNETYTQTVAIVVKDAARMDEMLVAMFNRVANLLRTHQTATALTLLTEPNRSAFGAVFNELDAKLPQIVDTFAGIGAISLDNELAAYALKRIDGENIKIFMIEYMRDLDGVWRIDSW